MYLPISLLWALLGMASTALFVLGLVFTDDSNGWSAAIGFGGIGMVVAPLVLYFYNIEKNYK